jgi:hypothetical protein
MEQCHEIADIIIDSQVVTRIVWIRVANDYEERKIKEKVTEEYFMCGICGRSENMSGQRLKYKASCIKVIN